MSRSIVKCSGSFVLAALWGTVLSAGLAFGLVGCDSGSTPSTPTADSDAAHEGHDHGNRGDHDEHKGHDHSTTQPAAQDSPKKSATDAVTDAVTDAMADGTEKLTEAGDAMTDKATEATESATEKVEALMTKADNLIEQVKTAITKKEFKVGETAMAQLEKMMGSLPASYQEQIKSLRSTFDKAVAIAKNVGESVEKLKDVKITNPLDVSK